MNPMIFNSGRELLPVTRAERKELDCDDSEWTDWLTCYYCSPNKDYKTHEMWNWKQCAACHEKEVKCANQPHTALVEKERVGHADTAIGRAVNNAGREAGAVSGAESNGQLPPESDPTSAGWVKIEEKYEWVKYYGKQGHRLAFDGFWWWGFTPGDCMCKTEDKRDNWREIDAKFFPREFRVGDLVECLDFGNVKVSDISIPTGKIKRLYEYPWINFGTCLTAEIGDRQWPVRALRLVKAVEEK
jgi:hypothetical protein